MRKQFTIFLILIFVLGLVPVNFSTAITQNQIDAEVQVYCIDKDGYGKSGSGTMIDPKGIILTNRHVIEGAYMNTCFIGFIESISQEPNFGTEGNYNLAEVKYQTASDDMDAAILYLDNPTNKIYPYINIWDSNSDALQFGDKIEVIGFPSIGGSTITYTSGDFSGFGSNSDGTQNYIKTTAMLEHGNSGGAAYSSDGLFIGIPTMAMAGTLNSLSYILSVNSIKNWLYSVLGNNYKEQVIQQDPIIEKPKVNIQDDITPPYLDSDWYDDLYICFYGTSDPCEPIGQDTQITGTSNSIYIQTSSDLMNLMGNELGRIEETYTSYSKILTDLNEKNEHHWYITTVDEAGEVRFRFTEDDDYEPNKVLLINKRTELQDYGTYFIGVRFADEYGNISGRHIFKYEYQEEPEAQIDNTLANRMSGQILLQVEASGEAYYVYPDDKKKYYLGRPADAFSVMRQLGLGATHDFITSHTIYPDNVLGKILIDVEKNGEAYYIYPKDKKAYYLDRPADAFRIMREPGLGITNNDLNKIPEGSL
ncbi:MAG: S1C family serine protease [Patescibacteria group bacterium]|nr:S1C family serine protease [Patescibacteria group bacterium]